MKRQGFTMVELMIVIAIIIILAAILFPVLSRVREHSVRAQCMTHMHLLGNAVAMYQQDNGSYPALPNPMMALVNAKLFDQKKLTCPKDAVDGHDSYGELYNYWGYQSGKPYPERLEDASKAKSVYTQLTNPKTGIADFWTLADTSRAVEVEEGPGTYFPGLVNNGVKNLGNVIVTACPYHAEDKFVILRIGGEVTFSKPTDDDFWALSKPAK